MEPLNPKLRQALKDAHPGLTDELIDKHERLLSQRFSMDPDTHATQIELLDRERAQILQEHMPQYRQVVHNWRKQFKNL